MYRRVAAAVLFFALGAGCADEGPGTLEVDVQADRSTLPADGSESGNLLVNLVYADGSPGELGTTVTILCFDSAQQPFGNLGGSSTIGVATVQVDDLGLADVSFRCSGDPEEEETVICLARTGSISGTSTPFRCVP